MCLIGLAWRAHPRHALVIAANRDEFFDRPAAGLDWWSPRPGAPWLLAGRDLMGGGTWMGLSAAGRVALLTNVRDPSRQRPQAASRGALVADWLASEAGWPADAGVNPYNILAGDLQQGAWWSASDTRPTPRPLDAGIHGLSNASLDTPWPKVQRIKAGLAQALAAEQEPVRLRDALLDVLADRAIAEDAQLPDTGIGLVRERLLSPIRIVTPDGRYGTRCSTVLIGERRGDAWHLQLTERTFDPRGRVQSQREVTLPDWPRHGDRPAVRVTAAD